jgi:hypothetical protein
LRRLIASPDWDVERNTTYFANLRHRKTDSHRMKSAIPAECLLSSQWVL